MLLFLSLIVVFTYSEMVSAFTCVTGRADRTQLARMITTSREFVRFEEDDRAQNAFTSERSFQALCRSMTPSADVVADLSRPMFLAGGFQPIRQSCLRASLERKIPPSIRRSACSNDNHRSSRSLAPEQCHTAEMIRYLHFKFNRAALCVQSLNPDVPFDTEFFFKVVNGESAFRIHVMSPQRGSSQLTGDAVRDLLQPTTSRGRTMSRLQNQIQDRELCAPYLKILEDDEKAGLGENGRLIPECKFNSVDVGIDRNYFYGMSYFMGLRQEYAALAETIKRTNPECRGSNYEIDPHFLSQITYFGYGDGPEAGRRILRQAGCDAEKARRLMVGHQRYQQLNGKFEELDTVRRNLANLPARGENEGPLSCAGYD